MSTKVAITAQDKLNITGHAGHCDFFFLYEIDEEGNFHKSSVEVNENDSLHNFLHGNPASFANHFIKNVDILLTQAIGQGAINKLMNHQVATYIIKENNPDTAIQKLIEGTLESYGSANDHNGAHAGCNCGGGHDHDHNHHH
jgi:predicted Fe-Mo cluster-binding NifX family protein